MLLHSFTFNALTTILLLQVLTHIRISRCFPCSHFYFHLCTAVIYYYYVATVTAFLNTPCLFHTNCYMDCVCSYHCQDLDPYVVVDILSCSVVWKLLAAHHGARKKRDNSSSKAPHSQFSVKILLFSEAVGSNMSFSAGHQVFHLSDHPRSRDSPCSAWGSLQDCSGCELQQTAHPSKLVQAAETSPRAAPENQKSHSTPGHPSWNCNMNSCTLSEGISFPFSQPLCFAALSCSARKPLKPPKPETAELTWKFEAPSYVWKILPSRASLKGAKWQRQQGGTGYQWIPRLTLPEYLFWKEKQTKQNQTQELWGNCSIKEAVLKCFYSLTQTLKWALSSSSLTLRSSGCGCGRNSEKSLQHLQPLLYWSLWAPSLEIPNGPSMSFTPTAAAAPKVSDCDHLKHQWAVLPPPAHKPCPWEAPHCQCSSLSYVIAYKNSPFQASLEWFHGAFTDLLINDLAVLHNKNFLGAETEAQH